MGGSLDMQKIVVAYGNRLTMAGARRALTNDGGFEIVGEARDGKELCAAVGGCTPDLVLLDAALPGIDTMAWLRKLRTERPGLDVVLSSPSVETDVVESAFRQGARGYVIETINPADLGAAIRQATDVPELNLERDEGLDSGSEHLTERELEVIEAVSRGLSNKAIAAELWVTVQTVKFHLTSIYRKLGISNRTQAARWALERDSPPPTDPTAE
jgi:DNA-binding NarL/FixJ family response regulator